jgi:hypothetical protein
MQDFLMTKHGHDFEECENVYVQGDVKMRERDRSSVVLWGGKSGDHPSHDLHL